MALTEKIMGRVFGFVGTIVTMAIGMYIYSLQVKTLTPGAGSGNPTEVATITGVKNDLIGIANANARTRPRKGSMLRWMS